jgi:DNA-binding response OmpR family regulator
VQDAAARAEPRKLAPSRPLRVLVIDDDRDMVLSLKVLLRAEGHVVRTLHDASDVLDQVRNFNPDVAILDIAMPGKTGWQAATEIRAGLAGKHLTLVGLSGEYMSGTDRSVSQMRGFDFYLMKPCDPIVLLTLLRRAVIQV